MPERPARTASSRASSVSVPADERQDCPDRSELAYPARWWRGSSGLDEEAVGDWFADVLGDG